MNLLNWVLFFFMIALIAGILGFTGIAGASAWVAKVFFFVFVALFFLSMLANLLKRAR